MTTDQAVAILLAECVLQDVGCEGPDVHPGTAWNDYVQEANRTLPTEGLWNRYRNGLHLLEND